MSFPNYNLENEAKSLGYKTVVGTDEAGRGCEHPSADILTLNGWKPYTELVTDDFVLSFTKDGKIVWQKIDFIVEKDFDGYLKYLGNRSVSIIVTPDHCFDVLRRTFKRDENYTLRMTGYTYGRRECVLNLKDNDYIPRGGIWEGADQEYFVLPPLEKTKLNEDNNDCIEKYIPMDLWLKFLGIYLSEGSINHLDGNDNKVIISQTKIGNKLKIFKELKKLPFNARMEKNGIVVVSRQLKFYLRQFGYCYDKFIPDAIKKLPSDKLQILIDWLILGDGTSYKGVNRKKVFVYYTTSAKLKDDFEEIVLKTNKTYKTVSRPCRDGCIRGRVLPKENMAPCYEIRIRQNTKITAKHLHRKDLKYKGKVFCLGLPEHHNFYIRRDGSGYFTGNCLAGPVVASAVLIPDEAIPKLMGKVNDSKKLSSKRRDELFNIITETCVFGVQAVSEDIIDEINILEATKLAMRGAISQIDGVDYVLIDGTVDLSKYLWCESRRIIKGDSYSISIAAASVIAKVTRDRMAVKLHEELPIYGFDKHKGYGTKEHIEAINLYGPCRYHRLTFNKVK